MKRLEFEECVTQNKLFETGVVDKAMAFELLRLAEHREKFWQNVHSKSEQFPSLFLEGHYEIVKELCTAILALDGWKAVNHECMFSYLRKIRGKLEIDFEYLLELKDLRNSIDYRGTMVSPDLWKHNELKIILTIRVLKEYLRDRIK